MYNSKYVLYFIIGVIVVLLSMINVKLLPLIYHLAPPWLVAISVSTYTVPLTVAIIIFPHAITRIKRVWET